MALGLLGSTRWACGPQAVAPRRVPRVGFFSLDTTASALLVEEFRTGLRALGYDDGTTVRVFWRQNDGTQQSNDEIVNEFIRMPVDVIVANGGEGQQTAKRATQAIPIVIVTGNDPVESGLVQGLAKPGGNITGIGGRPSIMKGSSCSARSHPESRRSLSCSATTRPASCSGGTRRMPLANSVLRSSRST